MTYAEKAALDNAQQRIAKLEAVVMVLIQRGRPSQDAKQILKQWEQEHAKDS